MYSEGFLRDGSSAWPKVLLDEYPAFQSWEGVESFQGKLAEHFGIASAQDVFLANRSAQLVRMAARLMFRTCRNVLTSDLNWPHWQAIITDEAARSGQRVTLAFARDSVFNVRLTATELNNRLETAFFANDCDGLFLPAVNNLGVRLPLSRLLSNLQSSGKLRFSMIDAAQSFCHLPQPSPATLADVTIAGCHKWLCGSLPLGFAVCGRPLVAEQLRAILKTSATGLNDLGDPLLRFSQQLCSRSTDKYSETVNIAPMFSANAAIRESRTGLPALREQASSQRTNMDLIQQAAEGTSWTIVAVDTSLQSGIVLMRSTSPAICGVGCDEVRTQFRSHRVALSTYPKGLVRISIPTKKINDESFQTLATAFASTT